MLKKIAEMKRLRLLACDRETVDFVMRPLGSPIDVAKGGLFFTGRSTLRGGEGRFLRRVWVCG